jgi:hypothetical protein
MTDAPGPFGPLSRDDRLPLEPAPSFAVLVASGFASLGAVDDTLARSLDALAHAGESDLEGETAGDFAELVGEVLAGDADGLDNFWQDIVDNGDGFVFNMSQRAAELPAEDANETETLPDVTDLGLDTSGPPPPAPSPGPSPGPGPSPSPPPPGQITEAQARGIITGWYHETLDREPDEDGMQVWLEMFLVRHYSVERVHAEFLSAAAIELAGR